MKTALQSVGIVFTILFICILALISMYASYVLGIGVLLISAFYIVNYVLKSFNQID